ncbi:polyprenyl synthetase family protein [Halococcus saccharolyticus]|uniref:Polyprenyl synthetase n=1 Tax=Halococcus saccharolyticus DSM 5350 TaxID=1227455 RepID=M0MMS4_9EURY|nr:polyprenyl synthetase family protein [Halococcus saccharolyticus]EMA45755.1 Polyprenyl synthetase [Halococcus saccharolyticus DSM 5350]
MRDVLAAWRPVIDREIERLLPREIDVEYVARAFGEPTYEYDPVAIQRALPDPIWNLLDRGGKRWRAVVCCLLIDGFGADPHEYLPYACIPEILHNGTIIVDDVEDGATMRRGEAALHREAGTDVALNAGNAMYFLPLNIVAHNPGDLDAEIRLAIYEMLMYELNRTHLGQGMDIHWHNEQAIRMSETQYLEMCACKTGCLGRIVARLAALITDQSDETERCAARYAERMSIAFQIGDDILDIENADEDGGAFGKAVGNDIREGKKTLMAIHAANEASPERAARLEELLWADENSDDEIREAIEILRETDSVAYARERALELAGEARDALRELDIDDEIADDLAEFTRFVIERDV